MRKIKFLSAVIFSILSLTVASATAQELESAANSNIVGTNLPANAQRVLPGSVPVEVTQTLEKLIAAGNGQLRQGETEVIVWTGSEKTSAASLAKQLQSKWQTGGWIFEIGGEQNGATIFTLLKDGANRRAVIGFYGEADGTFVLALTELHKAEENQPPAAKAAVETSSTQADLVGKWERKTGGVSSVDANMGRYLGSSGKYESYEFFADGRMAYTSLIAVQNYGCRLEAFSQAKGRINLSGSKMIVNLNAGTIRRDDSCSPSKNYTNPTKATSLNYEWSVGKDEYGTMQFCLTEPNGEKYCYRRVK